MRMFAPPSMPPSEGGSVWPPEMSTVVSATVRERSTKTMVSRDAAAANETAATLPLPLTTVRPALGVRRRP